MARLYRLIFMTWSAVAAAVLLLMLPHRSDGGLIAGRYSVSYAALLAFTALTLVIALVGWVLAQRNRLPDVHLNGAPWRPRLVIAVTLLALFLLWIGLPGAAFLPTIALWRAYLAALIAGALLVYVALEPAARVQLGGRWQVMAWGVVIVLALGLTARYLGRVPASLYFDEPLMAGYAWTCALEGRLGIAMLPPRDTHYLNLLLPLVLCANGWAMRLTESSLEVARLVGIVTVWLGTPFIYLTARRLYGRGAALMAAAVMLLMPLAHSHLRGDHYVALALAVVLWAYFRARERDSLALHALVGFVLATAIEGHQLGVRFIPVFGLVYLWDYAQAVRRAGRVVLHRPFVAFALGGLTYAAIYYLLHVVILAGTDLNGALLLLDQAYSEQLTVGGDQPTVQRWWFTLSAWLREYPIWHPAEVVLLTGTLLATVWRRAALDRWLLIVFSLSVLVYVVISPKPTPYYWIHTLPLLALLAAALVDVLREALKLDKQHLTLVTLVPLLLLGVLYSAHVIRSAAYSQNADRVMAISFDVDAHLPPDVQTITGHQVYFYGLAERDFYDLNTFAEHSVDEAMARWNIAAPQAVVLTRGLDEHPTMLDYMAGENMIAVRCYPTNFFGGETRLYVLPQYVDGIDATCAESAQD